MLAQIPKIKQAAIQWVWDTPQAGKPAWRRLTVNASRIASLVIRDLLEGLLTLRAMGLVYTTLLSLVPLLAVSFSVLKGFGVHNQVRPLLLNALAPLGAKGVEITEYIIGFVENMKAGVLGFLGLAFLIYTVVSLIQKIERAFNYTWHVTEHRPLAQRFSNYLSVILIGPVLVFSALGVTATVANAELIQSLINIEAVGALVKFATTLIPYLLVILAFTIIYIFVPNTRVRLGPALVGAVVAGILWETAGLAFASFVVNSAKYTAIYSAFATLILFMIWIYLSWLILLIGAQIAFYYQHPEYRKRQQRIVALSNRLKEKLALLVMAMIGKHFYEKKPARTQDALAQKLNITVETLSPILDSLVYVFILARTDNTPATYIPGQPPDRLPLADIVSAVRQTDEDQDPVINRLSRQYQVETSFNKMEQAARDGLHHRTLKDLVESG